MDKQIIIILALFLFPVIGSAQGLFVQHWIVEADSVGTVPIDTTMTDSISAVYRGWPFFTIYYLFSDVIVATTMYFEARILSVPGEKPNRYAIIDSLVVSTASSDWRVWNVTDGPVGINSRWRLRKSVTTDTLSAIYTAWHDKIDSF